ncbi:S-adenosylmethionine-6-N',N'-adenosyl (rRNA) dimethyltransferase [uncultured Woeseiaceae bacterium]|uniref:Ribosomal RNA small subunit methyltransferase A n=1 Tax=uncultured Woeseiaceae bacterium TaxID=1983305 RepID=A0A7D9H656_9GAMM|nr:S-adenosylmethionine-6-N',N'-adenosyl (rRNA) dimethyltransferase [uncultured Woeseiaceae bacterium]
MSHQARKRFGQHFLTSSDTIEQIVSAVAPQAGETIVEIGAGQAAITAPFANSAAILHAIEFDRDLIASLRRQFQDRDNVIIHEGDALQFDFSTLGDELRIVGNLPYNISTPLLFYLLTFKDIVTDMHFMLQKEVVDRMSATPGTKAYGRLTVMLGCQLQVVPLFDVPPDSFTPPPKVMSSVVRMRPLPHGRLDIQDPNKLEQIVRQAFSKRRKTLRNALHGLGSEADIEAAGLDPGKRPEQIPVDGWIKLANLVGSGK